MRAHHQERAPHTQNETPRRSASDATTTFFVVRVNEIFSVSGVCLLGASAPMLQPTATPTQRPNGYCSSRINKTVVQSLTGRDIRVASSVFFEGRDCEEQALRRHGDEAKDLSRRRSACACMHVCVHVCMCACLCACGRVRGRDWACGPACVCVCMPAGVRTCVPACMRACLAHTCADAFVRACVRLHACVRACVRLHACVRACLAYTCVS